MAFHAWLWYDTAMSMDANKTKPCALITGGAKRIGAFLAQQLAANGYDIVLHYRRSAHEAEALAKTLQAAGAAVTLRQADLEDTSAVHTLWQGLPPVHLLINNASYYARDTIASMNADSLQRHMQVNMLSPVLMAQQFMTQLPQNTHGNIVMLSDSAYGWSISPQFFSYALSKTSLNAITDLLASACAPHVRVNTLALGPTLSGEMDDEAMFARIANASALKQTSAPEYVWQALSMLLENSVLTGQVLELSSGLALRSYRPSS